MLEEEQFIQAFTNSASEWDLDSQTMQTLEKYVCRFYSSKRTSINETRYEN